MKTLTTKKRDYTAKIQAMLDKRGIVKIDKVGDYIISKTLIIHSNTRFVLAPGVRLVLAENARCALIQNEFFTGGGKDNNIEIIGGIFDGNCDKQGFDAYDLIEHRNDFAYSPDRYSGKLIRFAHVDNIVIEKVTVKDPNGYGIQIGDTNGFIVRNIFFDYNWHYGCTDGAHINGPATNGVIENLCGTTNDDMVSLTPVDEQHAEITYGDISNVTIKNVTAKNGYSGVRLLSCANYTIKNIIVDGVYGDYRHNAVLLGHHNAHPDDTRNYFDGIIIQNILSKKSHTPLSDDCFKLWENGAIEELPIIWFFNDINIGNISIKNVYREETVPTKTSLIKIEKEVNINRLVLDDISQNTPSELESQVFENYGTIKTLIKTNC